MLHTKNQEIYTKEILKTIRVQEKFKQNVNKFPSEIFNIHQDNLETPLYLIVFNIIKMLKYACTVRAPEFGGNQNSALQSIMEKPVEVIIWMNDLSVCLSHYEKTSQADSSRN